jgi:hypothetical protein
MTRFEVSLDARGGFAREQVGVFGLAIDRPYDKPAEGER